MKTLHSAKTCVSVDIAINGEVIAVIINRNGGLFCCIYAIANLIIL